MNPSLQQALSELQPIHPPAAISWWPPAPGWWALLLLSILLLHLGWRRYRSRKTQRAALKELHEIEQNNVNPNEQLAQLNRLLKRYLLSCNTATSSASLSGEAWLQFLDRHSTHPGFLQPPGQLLLSAPYRNQMEETDLEQINTLLRLSRQWIRRNPPNKMGAIR